MAIRPIRASRRWVTLIAVAAVPLMLSGLYAAVPGNASSTVPAGVQSAAVHTGQVAPGTVVHAATSTKPFVPTAAQNAARARDMKLLGSLPKPPIGPHTTAANVAKLRGAQTSPVHRVGPGAFNIFKDSTIPAQCPAARSPRSTSPTRPPPARTSCRPATGTSPIPPTAVSTTTWVYQNPYSLSSGFCCDQPSLRAEPQPLLLRGAELGRGFTEASDRHDQIHHADPGAPTSSRPASFGGTAAT